MQSQLGENRTQKGFVRVPNEILNNPNLSFGAKGLWAYMASKPEGWRFTIRLIATQSKDSRDAVVSRLKELLESRLVVRKDEWTPHGRVCLYSIFDGARTENTDEGARTENTDEANRDLARTDLANKQNPSLQYSNTELSKKEWSKKEKSNLCVFDADFDEFWAEYPRKADKKKAREAYIKIRSDKKYPASKEEILNGVRQYNELLKRQHTEKRYVKMAQGWLNGRRWEDEGIEAPQTSNVYNDNLDEETLRGF